MTAVEQEPLPLVCSHCEKTVDVKATPSGLPRIPRGWKRLGQDVLCKDCKAAQYRVAAIVIPVASPATEGKGSREEWDALSKALAVAWSKSTECANWGLRKLLSVDATRTPEATKCPPLPRIYLYGERDWTGWAASASAVLRTVEQTYRATRYEIVWRGSRSLPNVRYPYPFPIRGADWSLEKTDGGALLFSCRLPSGRVTFRLRSGHQYKRQLAGLQVLIDNPELRGEAAIYKRGGEVVVKIVGTLPISAPKETAGTLFLRTDAQSFLIGLNERDERLFIFNGDRARRWLSRHHHALQRWREDQKFEMRKPKRAARKNAEDMQNAVRKCHNRISSFIDETAAQCVNHAKRRKLARIVLDDSERSYFRDFQWFRLSQLLGEKCASAGIVFEKAVTEKEES